MITVGDAKIHRVEEMVNHVPIEALVQDAALIDSNMHWLAPRFFNPEDRTFPLSFHSWTLEVDGVVIVVDPCNGNGRTRPVFPFFNELSTPFLERFTSTGIHPETVDYVFCTHLHCDHCGWNTQMRDGRWVPTFPRARYLFIRREYERWDPARPDHHAIDYNVGVFEDSVRPIVDAGLADFLEDRHTVSASVAIEPSHGHTFGHSMLHLSSAREEAYFTGDVFHHPLQVPYPDLHLGGCDDPQMAIATRRRVVALSAERGALIIPAHLPAPHAGYVRRVANGFAFFPREI